MYVNLNNKEKEESQSMKKGKIALLTVSEGLNNHPSHIIEAVRLLISKEYETVFILPYPDHFKEITVPDHIRELAVDNVFSKADIAALIHIEKNPFIESLYDNDESKQMLEKAGIQIEDYSELVKPILQNLELRSSEGKDALLVYKARTESPTDEPEFQAALEICKRHGAVGMEALIYRELPVSDKQGWIDLINVLEPGFICTNEENDFLHELLDESNISRVDVAVITLVEGNKEQVMKSEMDNLRMH